MNKQAMIFDALIMLSVALGQKQEPKRLEIYVHNLKDLDTQKVIDQIQFLARTSKFFPQLVEIIEPVRGLDQPTDELAVIIASEILNCAARFSIDDIQGAMNFLGDKFAIAQKFGWRTLVGLSYEELPATRAQLRELAKAYINRTKREMREDLEIEFSVNTESLLCSSRDELSLQNNSRNNLFIEKQGAENEL